MDNAEIRLRIVESVVPVSSKLDITDPQRIVEKCKALEEYVIGETGRRKPGPKNRNNGNQSNQP